MSQTVANIRGIRAMALNGVFREKFDANAAETRKIGYKGAFVMSVGGGLTQGLPILSQGQHQRWCLNLVLIPQRCSIGPE